MHTHKALAVLAVVVTRVLVAADASAPALQVQPGPFDLTVDSSLDKFDQLDSINTLEPDGSEHDCLDPADCGVFTYNSTRIPYHTLTNASPLWLPPKCIWSRNSTVEYCLFTSTSFDSGRGISFLTTPDKAARIAQLPAFTDPSVLAHVNHEPRPPYEARRIPGKGIGLIANKTLHKGDHIFSNTPVLVVEEYLFTEFEQHSEHVPLQRLAIDSLPEAARDMFLSLHGHFGGDPYVDILNTNAFAVTGWPEGGEDGDVPFNACIPEISRLNHDCRPNSHYYFDWNTMTHRVHAIRSISVGEELTISYIDPLQVLQQRQDYLKLSWGFDCDCSACRAPSHVAIESDNRIEEILEVQETLADTERQLVDAPGMAEHLVSLYQQERLDGPISDAYTFAAHEFQGVGNKWKARQYALRAIEAGLLYGGPHDFDVKDLHEMLADQRKHWSWHFREEWP